MRIYVFNGVPFIFVIISAIRAATDEQAKQEKPQNIFKISTKSSRDSSTLQKGVPSRRNIRSSSDFEQHMRLVDADSSPLDAAESLDNQRLKKALLGYTPTIGIGSIERVELDRHPNDNKNGKALASANINNKEELRDFSLIEQVITGIPDLIQFKVYDNLNQVCDLFAHVGDQAPARLLRFYSRDYFEPTASIACYTLENLTPIAVPSSEKNLLSTKKTSKILLSSDDQLGSENKITTMSPNDGGQETTSSPTIDNNTMEESSITISSTEKTTKPLYNRTTLSTSSPSPISPIITAAKVPGVLVPGVSIAPTTNQDELLKTSRTDCAAGEVARFFKTADFELFGHDTLKMTGISLDECLDLCASNLPQKSNSSAAVNCNSFEFTPRVNNDDDDGTCVLSMETAVPLGNGQLKQRSGTDYYEKVCLDQKVAQECQAYARFPQMILVGFAETVMDANSLQQCFDLCLNSQQRHGFRCNSGMFYFEEPQLNCILNTEDRWTQPDLFTTETSDLVDYFEVTKCKGSNAPRRRPPQKSSIIAATPQKAFPNLFKQQEQQYLKKDFVKREDAKPGILQGIGQIIETTHLGNWSDWSECRKMTTNETSSNDQGSWTEIQTRWKFCRDGRVCAKEERQCHRIVDDNDEKFENEKSAEEVRKRTTNLDTIPKSDRNFKPVNFNLKKIRLLNKK